MKGACPECGRMTDNPKVTPEAEQLLRRDSPH